MSLFIGNIPRAAAIPDLYSIFNRFGRCSVDLKGNFAFIDFDHLKSAEEAIKEMQGKNIQGSSLSIEWSKKTKKKSKLPEPSNTSRNISKTEIQCYHCRETGHISKECRLRTENSMGHMQGFEGEEVLEKMRKVSGCTSRIRVKSPGRYSQLAGRTFNIVKLG